MAKRVEELECWRLADALRREVIAICAQEHVSRHFRFCEGFTDSSGSVCRNIAEGFGRFTSPFIVQFFGYAVASLDEVEDYLRESAERRFIDESRYTTALQLAERTRATVIKFRKFHERQVKARHQRKARTP